MTGVCMEMIAARIVCLSKDIALDHVQQLISAYLDYSHRWRIEQAAAKGWKYLVMRLSTQVPIYVNTNERVLVMDFAASSGHLDIVEWLHSTTHLSHCTKRAMDDASKNGHLATIQWLNNHRKEGCTTKAMDSAAMNGHLHVVKWLHSNRKEGATKKAMNLAAQNGHLNILKWFKNKRSEGCTQLAIDYAAGSGQLEVVKWLCEQYNQVALPSTMMKATRCGQMDIIEYLCDQFPILYKENAMELVAAAIASGKLELLRWFLSKKSTAISGNATDDAFSSWIDTAATFGHLNILSWITTTFCPGVTGTPEAIINAAANGHIHVLEYIHEHSLADLFTKDQMLRALVGAVHGGHLKCITWLEQHNHSIFEPTDDGLESPLTTVLSTAASTGRVDILQAVHESQCHHTEAIAWRTSASAINEAARQGFIDVLIWLRENEVSEYERIQNALDEPTYGPQWTSTALELAASSGHLNAVQWLTEHMRSTCSSGINVAMNAAAYMDHLDVVRYLHEHHASSCSLQQAIAHADDGGAEDTLLWLQTIYNNLRSA